MIQIILSAVIASVISLVIINYENISDAIWRIFNFISDVKNGVVDNLKKRKNKGSNDGREDANNYRSH